MRHTLLLPAAPTFYRSLANPSTSRFGTACAYAFGILSSLYLLIMLMGHATRALAGARTRPAYGVPRRCAPVHPSARAACARVCVCTRTVLMTYACVRV